MDSIIMQRKNKQNITKINTIITQYEQKLDKRVNQVITEMMNYTKKVTDPLELPILRDTRTQSQKLVEKQMVKKNRTRSTSEYTQLSFLTDTSLQAEVSELKNTFKQVESSKVIYDTGRPIGNKAIVRPKFAKKKPDILPRQVRLNPLHERNAIKAYELDKGLLSLIEKGKIGKDVNIITAFQKGRPILQTQKAIFHQGQERFAQLQSSQKPQPSNIKNNQRKIQKKEMNAQQQSFDQNWALTMPKDGESLSKNNNMNSNQLVQGTNEKSKILNLNFESPLYIKIVHFQYLKDKSFMQIMNKHLTYRGEIIQIVRQLQKLMKIYNIQIGYVDISKLMEYATKPKKLSKQQLMNCLVGCHQNRSTSLKNVKGIRQKYVLCFDKVISSFKARLERRIFLKYMQKKRIANRLYGWAVSRQFVKKHIQLIKAKRIQIDQDYDELQNKFKQNYVKTQQQRHYQIHLVNEQLRGKQNYKQILNIQLTKIFNIKNMNKYIIYILPYGLDEETINYYYKIMELQEIPNYKQRVSFLPVDPNGYFNQGISLSAKLYYNSQTLKKLKKKIKDFPAYFVVSYPSLVNVKLAYYLKIPILSGNLNKTLQMQKLTNLEQFKLQVLEGINVKHQQFPNLTTLSDHLSQFCRNNKRITKYVIKINGKHKSSGIALLATPFTSLPEMYQKTTLIIQNQTVDNYYHELMKYGGIIQKYEEGSSLISIVMEIESNENINVVGTFQKISSGFVNIGYVFPQKKVDHKLLCKKSKEICQKLASMGHFGSVEITFMLTQLQDLYLQKVRCYSTHLQSSLYYYKFLTQGSFDERGEYLAKIVDNFEQDGKEEQIVTQQPRSFCFIPFLLHFGLSQRQVNSFFQLCRMGGVSFDLQNKYGATFILLGNLKSCMGLITTAKDKKGSIKLLLKSLDFLMKQNSHNMSNQTLAQKEQKMKQRQNIINIKERLEQI